MKIKFFGHAAFLIEGEGKRIITDPYKPNAYNSLKYKPISSPADIVTISHDHEDHNYYQGIKGNPVVIKEEGEKRIDGIKIKGISTFHDRKRGKERGKNIIFVFEIEGIRVAHLGDLGTEIEESVRKEMGSIDILLLPVGGYFTIDAEEAKRVSSLLRPKVIIPMHYKTSLCDFPIAPVDDFLLGEKNCRIFSGSQVEIKREDLKEGEIWVLNPEGG
jgi:L-ascorbate metabolism protein UlaG (beta-lactamase superfamily)|uniref:MBL fold metallo-hydrolase n=1 Tax=candidate division WOR-3 bacterium TaxID=2052148 RepID=A0A7C3YTK6_UNCW3